MSADTIIDVLFKAWNERLFQLFEVFQLDFEHNLIFCRSEDGQVRVFGAKDVILLEYRGIDDKDGQKIFAGDVMSYCAIHYTDCSQTEIESIDDEEFIEIISYHPMGSIIKPHSTGVKCFGWDQETGEGLKINLKSAELKRVGNVYKGGCWLPELEDIDGIDEDDAEPKEEEPEQSEDSSDTRVLCSAAGKYDPDTNRYNCSISGNDCVFLAPYFSGGKTCPYAD